jgi:hypothetical protein
MSLNEKLQLVGTVEKKMLNLVMPNSENCEMFCCFIE